MSSGGGWLKASEAKKQYFLTTLDLEDLDYKTPVYHGWGMGRPSKYYDPQELKRKAEAKHGIEGFQAKLQGRENRERKRQQKEVKEAEEARSYAAKKAKLIQENPNRVKEFITDLESLVALTKKCDSEQLQQLILMAGETSEGFMGTINQIKDVAMLPRNKFGELKPKLAKLFDTNPENTLKKSMERHKRDVEEHKKQKEVNEEALDVHWNLEVTSPPSSIGETGYVWFTWQNGLLTDGEIVMNDGSFSHVHEFKGESSISSKTMEFNTQLREQGQLLKGSLSVSVTEDAQDPGGLAMTGVYHQGFKAMPGLPSVYRFNGKAKKKRTPVHNTTSPKKLTTSSTVSCPTIVIE